MSADERTLAERVRELFDYDALTGELTRKVSKGNKFAGTRAGSLNRNGYRQLSVGGVRYQEHRIIWLYWHGRWPTHEIDHIDGDKANNRISNLRDAPRDVNMQNARRARKDSSTGVIGVTTANGSSRSPWVASIKTGGKRIHLGCFSSREEASASYVHAKRQLHKGNTL